MENKNFVINGNEYEFVCTFCSHNNGFRHICTLLKNNIQIATTSCHYLNRTWESYTFQSVMRQVITTSKDKIIQNTIENYKKDNNIKKLSNKIREKIEEDCKNNKEYNELTSLYMKL